jgi:Pentapeptide repeats (9 copies)
MAVWLLLAYTSGDTDANRVQLDAIRTAGTIVVGTGGAAALLLAARRQRSIEIALRQKDRDQVDVARAHAFQERIAEQTRLHQERIATANEDDAEARRITELYTKAVEQLGSDKAPVRLGGLYALERVAQNTQTQRQTVVNVLCAYLRMPYQLPGKPPGGDSGGAEGPAEGVYRGRMQEREVRLAAQRLLAAHLRPGDNPDHPQDTFWADLDLDLTGALLIDLDFTRCSLHAANFTTTQFSGATVFNDARSTSDAWFVDAQFNDDAFFTNAQFAGAAGFTRAHFSGDASFNWAQFNGNTWSAATWFPDVQFNSGVGFNKAQFTGPVSFEEVRFAREPGFQDARFVHDVPAAVARFVVSLGEGDRAHEQREVAE